MSKKIAFIQNSTFSHINTRVKKILAEEFPGVEIQTIDVWEILKGDLRFFIMNLIFIFREYGWDIVLRRKRAIDCIFITTYFFKMIKAIIGGIINRDEYLFSFQTQSLFDASTGVVPHFVYTDHTYLENLMYPGFNPRRLPGHHWLTLERSIYINADKIFIMSTNIRRSLLTQYSCPKDKIVYVSAGSNVEHSEDKGLDGKDYSQKNILFVGLEWERKGGPELVEAFRKASLIHPDATLTIAGSSPKLKDKNIRVEGYVPLSRIGELYKEATVFCMPTKLEPFGIVFLEAMMYRLPIVATNIGAIPDFIEDGLNGYTVEPGDSDSLASALITLLDCPEKRKDFGQAGYEIFREKYMWEKVAEKLKSNIGSMISSTEEKKDRRTKECTSEMEAISDE